MGEYADLELDRYTTTRYGFSIYGYNDTYLCNRERERNMSDFTTVFVTGKIYWAKVIGKPVANYEGTAREWTFDFVPDDTSFLKEHGLLDRLKDPKEPVDGPFLRLRKPELDSEGKENEPIRIYTDENEAWDGALLGNGTEVDLKLTVADWGRGKKKSIWTKAIRVTKLVPYVSNEFAGMDKDGEKKTAAKGKAKAASKAKPLSELDEDLDDEVPF